MSTLQLIAAVKGGDLAKAKELLQSGDDINQQDEQGWTALNWAAGKGWVDGVTLLLENGADVFRAGRDQRTPYKIALAAGHAAVVRILLEAEKRTGKPTSESKREYCKAYSLSDFRRFSGWTESKINWKVDSESGADSESACERLSDEDIVFLHSDLTVTQSMWHNENIIFNRITPEWQAFCTETLQFKVPTDLDLIAAPVMEASAA
jgi:ankyrin repeat protein